MAGRVRKQRSIRMYSDDWKALDRAAAHESRRRGERIEGGTLAREIIVRGIRRINARAALRAQPPEMAVA